MIELHIEQMTEWLHVQYATNESWILERQSSQMNSNLINMTGQATTASSLKNLPLL